MPKVHFANDDLTYEAEPGMTMPKVVQESGASLPFGCRAGTCGTCVLTVISGMENLDPRGFVEEDTLHVLGVAGEGRRLGCQIIVREGDFSVEW